MTFSHLGLAKYLYDNYGIAVAFQLFFYFPACSNSCLLKMSDNFLLDIFLSASDLITQNV